MLVLKYAVALLFRTRVILLYTSVSRQVDSVNRMVEGKLPRLRLPQPQKVPPPHP